MPALPARATRGGFFQSFDEAWAHFLARDEPLESFWELLSDDSNAIDRYLLIIPPLEVKQAVQSVQASFAGLDSVAAVPPHFLHVTAPAAAVGWGTREPFEVTYRRVNSFHDAAVVEVQADDTAPFPPGPFLPHMSIGYFRRAEPPDALRNALIPLRDVDLGSGVVEEVVVCDVPVAKSRFFDPWRVVERIRLAG